MERNFKTFLFVKSSVYGEGDQQYKNKIGWLKAAKAEIFENDKSTYHLFLKKYGFSNKNLINRKTEKTLRKRGNNKQL